LVYRYNKGEKDRKVAEGPAKHFIKGKVRLSLCRREIIDSTALTFGLKEAGVNLTPVWHRDN